MNILLIQPPVRDFYQTAIRTQPLGLAYLAAALIRQGHSAAILDCQTPGLKQKIPTPCGFNYMQPAYQPGDISPFRLYSSFYHYGISYERIKGTIRQHRPDAVGISCQFTPYYRETLQVAALAKAFDPAIPVIIGGAHASACPKEMLAHPDIDYVIIGEGEESLPLLLQCLTSGSSPSAIPGLGWKKRAAVTINPRTTFIADLDRLPLPARELLDHTQYTIDGNPYSMLLTSRGCPRKCTYCSVKTVMGTSLRLRSPQSIIAEIRHCYDTYGISIYDIEDDNFTHDPLRAEEILTGIIREFGAGTIKLLAMNGLSIISLTDRLLAVMKKAGFQRLDLALGSSSPAVNKKMNRPADLKKTDAVLESARQTGFAYTTYILLGVPGHSLADMLASIFYLAGKPSLIGPSIFYPSPGTQAFDDLAATVRLPDYSFLRSSLFPVETDSFTRPDITTLLRLVRWINFAKQQLVPQDKDACAFSNISRHAPGWWPDDLPRTGPLPKHGRHYISFTAPPDPAKSGKILTALLFRSNLFYGLRRLFPQNKALYTYELFPYITSAKVMQLFTAAADELVIRRAHAKKKITLSAALRQKESSDVSH